MILIRYLLIYNWLSDNQIFHKFGKEGKSSSDMHKTGKKNNMPSKKVSKEIGEYIDYEEIEEIRSLQLFFCGSEFFSKGICKYKIIKCSTI